MSGNFITILFGLALLVYTIVTVSPKASMAYDRGTYVLKNFHGSKASYGNLVRALNNAQKGQEITIVLRNNYGGYNHIREYLDRAVQRSKATVTIKIERYAGSNAALFFRMGDRAIVPYSAKIMFHQSYTDNWYGKRYPKHLYKWSVRIHSKVGAFSYMTKSERRLWENRKNVYISGNRICRSKFVIKRYGSYCVIRGQK